MDALVLLGSLSVLVAIGVPVAYALGLSAIVGAIWIELPLDAVMIQIASGVNKFSLLAIPFFVLAGAIMAEGGMAHRLVAFAAVFVGFIRGGLSLVNILASTFFGAISDSSVADTASVGTVLIPEMEKKGYPRPLPATSPIRINFAVFVKCCRWPSAIRSTTGATSNCAAFSALTPWSAAKPPIRCGKRATPNSNSPNSSRAA
jgi:hypothetical protein